MVDRARAVLVDIAWSRQETGVCASPGQEHGFSLSRSSVATRTTGWLFPVLRRLDLRRVSYIRLRIQRGGLALVCEGVMPAEGSLNSRKPTNCSSHLPQSICRGWFPHLFFEELQLGAFDTILNSSDLEGFVQMGGLRMILRLVPLTCPKNEHMGGRGRSPHGRRSKGPVTAPRC